MGMKKQVVLVGIAFLLFCVGITGCTNNPLDAESMKFVGTWKSPTVETDVFTCRTDKTFTSNVSAFTGTGTWEIQDEKLVLSFIETPLPTEFNYFFINNGRTLTLTPVSSGQSSIFIKQ